PAPVSPAGRFRRAQAAAWFKTPGSKVQLQNKGQTRNPKPQACSVVCAGELRAVGPFEAWDLKLLWNLDPGIWCFSFRRRRGALSAPGLAPLSRFFEELLDRFAIGVFERELEFLHVLDEHAEDASQVPAVRQRDVAPP